MTRIASHTRSVMKPIVATVAVALLGGLLVAAPSARAAADPGYDPTYGPLNTSTTNGVTISVPQNAEAVAGQPITVPITIGWDRPQSHLKVDWSYAGNASATLGWTVVKVGSDIRENADGGLTIDAGSANDWNGYYLQARIRRYNGDASIVSPVIPIQVIAAPDTSAPTDQTVQAGSKLVLSAQQTAPYLTMGWQVKAKGASDWEQLLYVAPRGGAQTATIGPMLTTNSGSQYRPVFYTERGVAHPGRTMTLTVTPSTDADGIAFDPAKHAYRYYVDGVDQNPADGTQIIAGNRYFVKNGDIELGYVEDPSLPGGYAHFTIAGGMTTGTFLRDGDSLRYVDENGAVRRAAGDAQIDGKTYTFDDRGYARQVIGQYRISMNGGPGVVRVRILQVDGVSSTVDFAATTPGRLGGSASDKTVVKIGDSSLKVGMNQQASTVAQGLTDWFARSSGQPSGRETHLVMTRGTTTIVDTTNTVPCPPQTGPMSRVIQGYCPAPPPGADGEPQLPAHFDELFEALVQPLATMTPETVEETIGGQDLDTLNTNVQQFLTAGALPDDVNQLGAQFVPIATIMTATEQGIVRPVITAAHTQVNDALREELQKAIDRFNAGDSDGVADQADDIREGISTAAEGLAEDLPLDARELATTAVARYLITGDQASDQFQYYREEVDGQYLEHLDELGVNDPIMQPLVAANTQFLAVAAYQDTLEIQTRENFRVYRQMLDILEATPAHAPDGTLNSFTYANLEAQARQVLGLPAAQ